MESFKFDHSLLYLAELQSSGIRSVTWLEESFYDSLGRMIEITEVMDTFPAFASFGFCDTMLPIFYVFETGGSDDIIIRSRQARIMTRQEIQRFYCRK